MTGESNKMTEKIGRVIWLTGLPGSGKSTLAEGLVRVLDSRGIPHMLLDGDVLRTGLNRDLGFSVMDRAENIRRAGETAKILCYVGLTVVAAFITPQEILRRALRSIFPKEVYVEVYVDCPLDVCESRDPKGHYKKARQGIIKDFTGVSAVYEPPEQPDASISTGHQGEDASLRDLVAFLDVRFPKLRGVDAESLPAPGRLEGDEHAGRGPSGQGSGSTRPIGSARRRGKLAVIGLDCVPPSILFGDVGRNLPNLGALMRHGIWGRLKSTDPPITIPAWTTATTGRDPGELGMYGFRNRVDRSYHSTVTSNATHVKYPRAWDYLEQAGLRSILVGIPQTYPAVPHNGITVPASCPPAPMRASLTRPSWRRRSIAWRAAVIWLTWRSSALKTKTACSGIFG
ncbi:MAG: adenylyl-sulfate kinase [Pseudomonadota bacterium]